jgi:hypothetical protein
MKGRNKLWGEQRAKIIGLTFSNHKACMCIFSTHFFVHNTHIPFPLCPSNLYLYENIFLMYVSLFSGWNNEDILYCMRVLAFQRILL